MLALAVSLPSIASAAECTNTWTGPAEGSWTTAGNWSAKHVPNESDVACIGSGKTVNLTSGTQKVSVVQGEGALKIEKSTLELLSGSEGSQIKTLTMKFEAVLSGSANLNVTNSFTWSNTATMSGSGATILESGVSGSITAAQAKLVGRKLVNHGTLSYTRQIIMSEGAVLENTGTLLAKDPEAIRVAEGSKSAPLFVNTGTFKKTEGTGEAPVEVSFENQGTVNGEKGSVAFRKEAPTFTLASGSVLEGTVLFKESNVTAESFSGAGTLRLKNATMTMKSGSSATVSGLKMEFEGNVAGAGTLAISGNLEWASASTMSGTGKTVIQSGATGSVITGSVAYGTISERTFVNEGSFSLNKGSLRLQEGAAFENKSTLTVNMQENKALVPLESKVQPVFINTGTVQKTEGTGTSRIQVNVENSGTINGETGTLAFDKSGQTIALASGTSFKGTLLFEDSSINAASSFTSSGGQVTLHEAKLTVAKGVTATFGTLILKYGAEILGEGTLAIAGTLEWANASTMAGTGKTVIQSGATGLITTGSGAYGTIKERTFVNEGSVSINSGMLRLQEGVALENKGTLTVNMQEGKNALAPLESKVQPVLINTGTVQKTEGTSTSHIQVNVENSGAIKGESGTLAFDKSGQTIALASGTSFKGALLFESVSITATSSFTSSGGKVAVHEAKLTVAKGVTATFGELNLEYGNEVLGDGTLSISNTLEWSHASTMAGTGKTVIQSGATGLITTGSGTYGTIKERTFINEGSVAINEGMLRLSEGAAFENKGTLTVNMEEGTDALAPLTSKVQPVLINTGTVQKTGGKGTSHIQVNVENSGAIKGESGTLAFDKSGQTITLASGTSFKGTLLFESVSITATSSFTSSGGKVAVHEAKLTVAKGVTATFGELNFEYGNEVLGDGTLSISNTLEWSHASTMAGTGKTVIQSGATGSVTTGSVAYGTISERTFVNEGSISLNKGSLRLQEGAAFENKGTLTVNMQENQAIAPLESKVQPVLINTGTVQKIEGTGTSRIQVNVENFSTIKGETGTLAFDKSGQTITLASGTSFKGALLFEHSTVIATSSFASTGGQVAAREVKLTVSKGTTATFSELIVEYGTEVLGAGTLAISGHLDLDGGSTLTGSGLLVIDPGALCSTAPSGGTAKVSELLMLNEGEFAVNAGTLRLSEGSVFLNEGTLTVNYQGTSPAIDELKGEELPLIANYGVIHKTSGEGKSRIAADVANYKTVDASTGSLDFDNSSGFVILGSGSALSGSILFENTLVTAENVTSSGEVTIDGSYFDVSGGSTASFATLKMRYESVLTGAGTVNVSKEFHWDQESEMAGSGTTKLLSGSVNAVDIGATKATLDRSLINEGMLTMTQQSRLKIEKGERLQNRGTFRLNQEPEYGFIELLTGEGHFFNGGTFERTEGKTSARVATPFENQGVIKKQSSDIVFDNPIKVESSEVVGAQACSGDPVDCATGNFTESQTDFAIGGRGVGLDLTRTYSAQGAAEAASPGAFGYGWTASFSDHLTVKEEGAEVTLTKGSGNTASFSRLSGTTYAGPAWSQETLSGSPEAGYTLTEPDQVQWHFSGAGRLESVVDRNGNETTLSYDEAGRLKAITDPAGRQIKLTYNGGGQIESAEDPMGHLVKYGYEGGNLSSVTLPGEESSRWQFKYDASHRITTVIDGRGGKTTNEYDGSNQVVSQTDPAGRTLAFEYEPFHTQITNEATGAVTDEWFTSSNEPYSITRGYGTADATTATFSYNEAGQTVSKTDGDGHTTTYGYDAKGNKTSEKGAVGSETKWAYNATHDVISKTTPGGETTTIKRDGNGNVESVLRPGPEETTQTTSFAYDENGQLESLTDPLKRTWTYGYNAQGDRTSKTDPLGDTETFGYDKDSRLISTVLPRGNVEGAKPAEYEITVERDPQGRPLVVTDPLGNTTEYAYDGNGNLEAKTDANGNTTKYAYNADDEQTKVEKPNGAILETGYDGAGQVTSQTDANERTTTYVRNVLEEPVEAIDPLGRKTIEEFDAAGNLKAVIDPAERKTSYAYDGANRLVEVNYAEEATPDTEFEYDPEGNVTRMVDGTGESRFEYDQLGRLTEAEDGHGDVVGYGYSLAEELTGIAYPSGKSISRSFDPAGRLESVTDWLGGTTTFSYDPDSNLEAITFPKGTGNVDAYAYDRADRMSKSAFTKGAETLASLSYGRDKLGQIEEEASTGLPGAKEVSYGYDENERLSTAGAESFEYDPADNMLKGLGSTNAYDAASQLETGTGVTYGYDKLGERIKATPGSGPATTYKYDQTRSLTAVEQPEEGETPAIAESFAYDGTGLLASRTVGLSTQHLTWDSSKGLPLLLSDGESSYIYGPGGLPIEQISSGEEPTYLHHDQLGSTRLLTNSAGEVSGSETFTPYGAEAGKSGTATSPFGFAGQYTLDQSGLIYLRARYYDPGTAQFLTQDPALEATREPYAYAGDNPLRFKDSTGLGIEIEIEVEGMPCLPCEGAQGVQELLEPGVEEAVNGAGWVLQHSLGVEELDEGEFEEGSSVGEVPCPEETKTEIGDRGQRQTYDRQFAEKLGHALGSSPEWPTGGSRLVRIAALLARLLHMYNR